MVRPALELGGGAGAGGEDWTGVLWYMLALFIGKDEKRMHTMSRPVHPGICWITDP